MILGEIRDVMVRIVYGRRVTVYRSDLVELFGLITCGVRGIGQVTRTVVFEIQALVVTQPMHILSFFAPKFWLHVVLSQV